MPQTTIRKSVNLRGASSGVRDQTLVRFALAEHVDEIGLFIPADKLLASLVQGDPITLPAGQPDASYSWTLSFEELGLGALPELQLRGVMPHMHEYGRSYRMHLSTGGEAAECMAEVKHWDFHWQRMFFYETPVRVTPESELSVDCRYDTSEAQAPVQPGWGTRNEMCAAILYMTMPNPL
jgi:hypothetical protein